MTRLLPLFALMACGTSYTQTFEHGGQMSLTLEPVTAGAGISVDVAMDGLSQKDVDGVPEGSSSQAFACPAPYLTYATDTGTGEPIFGVLLMCAKSIDLGGTSCPGPVSFEFDLDGDTGDFFLSMDPIGQNTSMGDQFWIDGELTVDDPMIGTKGSLTGTVIVDDGCMAAPVEHTIALEWDFPLHTEVKTTEPFDWSFDLGS